MSLTNPNKVVTEERLKDFYDGILPYLGGMPEMVANKFSKSDIYSTSEKMIGQWYNGKPIYQKVVTGTIPNCVTDGAEVASSISIGSTIDEIVGADGWYISAGTWIPLFTRPLSATAPTTWTAQATLRQTRFMVSTNSASSDKNAVIVKNSNASANGCNCKFIIKYTKTTDSAISIGNETDYSTTEKIVGTWIDGKPIYQKTVSGTFPTTTDGTYADKAIATISGVGNVIKMEGWYIASSTKITFPWISNGGYVAKVKFYNNAVTLSTNASSVAGITAYVTAQYTKTT